MGATEMAVVIGALVAVFGAVGGVLAVLFGHLLDED